MDFDFEIILEQRKCQEENRITESISTIDKTEDRLQPSGKKIEFQKKRPGEPLVKKPSLTSSLTSSSLNPLKKARSDIQIQTTSVSILSTIIDQPTKQIEFLDPKIQLSRNLTEEQKLVIQCNGDRIFIQAFAGAGKTSTLEEYCRVRPKERFLYIAFNKTVQETASKKFGRNVECRTIDSMCFEIAQGRGKSLKDFRVTLVKDVLKDIARDNGLCWKIFNLLKRFFDDATARTIDSVTDNEPSEVVGYASDIWNMAIGGRCDWTCHTINRKVALLKDGGNVAREYLEKKFDTILLDECQDVNSIMLSVINKFGGRKIFIGDTHQAIYSFMGCINAFKMNTPSHSFQLSRSFRFGDKIAERADWIISRVKKPLSDTFSSVGIKGYGDTTVIEDSMKVENYTVLSRVNKTLFQSAHSYSLEGKKKIFWLGKEEFFKKIRSLLDIFEKSYMWERKMREAEEDGDVETITLMEMIEFEGQKNLEEKMKIIDDHSAREKEADVILSTVHKAKGLEWDHVKVCDDIALYISRAYEKYLKDEKNRSKFEEECNIYYVAITRAVKCLVDDAFDLVDELAREWISKQKQSARD